MKGAGEMSGFDFFGHKVLPMPSPIFGLVGDCFLSWIWSFKKPDI